MDAVKSDLFLTYRKGVISPISQAVDQRKPGKRLPFAKSYAQVFAITDSETGLPLANREFVALVDGKEVFGITDIGGLAHVQATSEDAVISIHVLFKSPARTLGELKEATR